VAAVEGLETLNTLGLTLDEPYINNMTTMGTFEVATNIGTTMDGPADNDNEVKTPKIRFFTLIPGLKHIEIDPAPVLDCGPLRAQP